MGDKKTHGLHFALFTIHIFGFPTLTFTNGVSCTSIATKDGSQVSISGCGGQGGIFPGQSGDGEGGGGGGEGGDGTGGTFPFPFSFPKPFPLLF